ncbi:hypothetical protein SUGI_1045210 [Cryptomeria japonica]|nr:hypothetical protein SUGI_1045210 [Cryptomeria japonica]
MSAVPGEDPSSLHPDPPPNNAVGSHTPHEAPVSASGTPLPASTSEKIDKNGNSCGSSPSVLTKSGQEDADKRKDNLESGNKKSPSIGPENVASQKDAEEGKKETKSNWKSALVGSTNTTLETALANFIQTEEGTEIKLPDNLMDKIASSLHLALVGRFFSFRPSIDMVR